MFTLTLSYIQLIELYILLYAFHLKILKQTSKDGLLQRTFTYKITNLTNLIGRILPL